MSPEISPAILDTVLLRTDYPELELHASGKVRDVYSLDSDHLLFVATDRISAFDYVLATGIPHKGRVLTQLSLFWFDFLKDIVPNHFVTADVNRYPAQIRQHSDELRGRSMIVMRAEMFPVECVARGYLSGSGWKEYKATGTVCGIKLPAGLRESDQLPEPLFTPATKATTGHDINISFEGMCKLVDPELSRQLRDITLRVYKMPPIMRASAASSSPTPSLNLDRPPRASPWRMKCSPRSPRASGRPTLINRARRRTPTTSSMYGITSKKFAGTSNRPRRRCRKTLRCGRAKSISGRIVS